MKQGLLICALLVFASSLYAGQQPPTSSRSLDWVVKQQWKLDTKPLDFVHTLDNQKVYVLGADSQVHIFTARGVQLGTIPVDKGVTAIDIAPRGELLYLVNKADQTFTSIAVDFTTTIDITGNPFIGNENAPVTIVIFSDFQCPFCGRIQPLMEQMLEKNPNILKIVFKNFPLVNMHKMAQPAARAAVAAQNQGKFWQMHDALFGLGGKLSLQSINSAAQNLGLDMDKFTKDMNSQKVRQRVQKDIQDANRAGVRGTPTLFINGRHVRNRGLQALQHMIDQELAKADKGPSN